MTLDGPLANRAPWRAEDCSIAMTMQIVGTRSAMLLMREAFYGTTRFDDFADRVGITQAIASARLKALVADGLLTKRPYQVEGQRTRDEYVLTDKGTDLLPALLALMQWGDTHLYAGDGPVRVEDASGAPVQVQVVDGRGRPIGLDDMHLATGWSPRRRRREARRRAVG